MPKLDLINSRSPVPEPKRVFDSLEYVGAVTDPRLRRSQSCDFRKTVPRNDDVAKKTYHSTQTLKNAEPKFEAKSVVFRKEHPVNAFYYNGNEAAKTYYCFKPRIKTELMDRMLDRMHDMPDDGVAKCVEKGLVQGVVWGKKPIDRGAPIAGAPHLGPGCYDVKYQDAEPHGVHISSAPTGREEEAELDDGPAPCYYSPNPEFVMRRSAVGVVPFSSESRFDGGFYRAPNYLKTNGLLLSPYYDQATAWERPEIPVTLSTREPRLPEKPDNGDLDRMYAPDVGPKASIQKAVETSPIKHAASFRSLSPVRTAVFQTTGPELGPGAYETSILHEAATSPGRKHTENKYFQHRHHSIELLGSRYSTLNPRTMMQLSASRDRLLVNNATSLPAMPFGHRLPTEPTLREATSFERPAKHWSVGNLTKNRIKRIYPKLYKRIETSND